MKSLLVFVLMLICYCTGFAQMITGTVKDAAGDGLSGAEIKNVTKNRITNTNQDGAFAIEASPEDKIEIGFPGFTTLSFKVTADKTEYDIVLKESNELIEVTSASLSPRSIWTGAKIGYNFEGDPGEEFVGAAKISINAVKLKNDQYSAGVIGNLADFVTDKPSEDGKSKLQNLTLSVRGLAVGLYGLKFLDAKKQFRTYLTSTYRLNTYKNVGADSATVNIGQFRNSVGVEFEGLEWEKNGKLNVSVEGSLGLFDKARYNKVFNDQRKILATLECTIILPLSSNIGFFVNGSFTKGISANYITGIVIKPS